MATDEQLSADLARSMSTAPSPVRQPELGPLGWARWAWRLLTSMRTALVLLFLLAVAAVPGSLLPQRPTDPGAVTAYLREHPSLGPVYDALWLYDVFASPWFSAIYLLLFISLVGCVLPRSRVHWRASRARPPAAPRSLARLPQHRSFVSPQAPDVVLSAARSLLRRRRYRVDLGSGAVAAERGFLRETGNLLFHLSLIVVLVAVAVGHLFGFRADIIVPEGGQFANVDGGYDTFTGGPRFDPASLTPFSVALDSFDVTYQQGGSQSGAPRSFRADVSYSQRPGGPTRHAVVASNQPLVVDGTKVFLTGNGYAPVLTVRDGSGRVVHEGPVPFLPQDANMTSQGVLKLPDARAADGTPVGLGLTGLLLPTAAQGPSGVPISRFPDDLNPRVLLTGYTGDLGLDDGTPQSVYRLDVTRKGLTQLPDATDPAKPYRAALALHETATLPGGNGTVTFERLDRFVNFKVARDPGTVPAAGGAALAIAGLMASLFVRRRRLWVRAAAGPGGRTVVEVAGLSRTEEEGLAGHVDDVAEELAAAVGAEPIDPVGAAGVSGVAGTARVSGNAVRSAKERR